MKATKPDEEAQERAPAIPRIIAYSDSESDDDHPPPSTVTSADSSNNTALEPADAFAVLHNVAASLQATDLIAVRSEV